MEDRAFIYDEMTSHGTGEMVLAGYIRKKDGTEPMQCVDNPTESRWCGEAVNYGSLKPHDSSEELFSPTPCSHSPPTMKLLLAAALIAGVLTTVSGSIYGQGNAHHKKFPGGRPISPQEYQELLLQQQQQQQQQKPTPKPDPSWMFDPSVVPARVVGVHPVGTFGGGYPIPINGRPAYPRYQSYEDTSDEDN